MGNAKALQSYTTTTIPVIENYLNNHSGKSVEDFIDEEIIPYFEFPDGYDETDDHILVISKPGSNTNISIRLDYMPTEYHLAMINNGLWLRADNEYKQYTKYIYFYNNGENYGTSTNWTLSSASAENVNNLGNDVSGYGMGIVGSQSNYNYNYIISTSYNNFEYRLKSAQSESFKVNNGTTYNFNDNVDIGFLSSGGSYNFSVYNRFHSPDPIYCKRYQVLGGVSSVNDLVIKIKGVSNSLSKPIWGKFQLSFTDDLYHSVDEFDIQFINFLSGSDADVVGSYNFTCSDNGGSCFLEYSYNYIDDIDTEVEFGFKISPSSGNTMPFYINLFNCFDNDDFYNITYTYTNSSGGTISNDNILNNFLQDGSVPDVSVLADTNLIPSGPVDSILTLPLNVMRSLLNTLNTSTCSPLVLPIPFTGGNLTLPCISTIYAQINGLSVFLTWFSAIFSAFLLYKYFIYLYKWVDDTLTLRENNHFGGY